MIVKQVYVAKILGRIVYPMYDDRQKSLLLQIRNALQKDFRYEN